VAVGAPAASSCESVYRRLRAAEAAPHLHVDRRAGKVADCVEVPVRDRARRLPRLEHRDNRRAQLLHGISGEGVAVLLVDALVAAHERAQRVRGEGRVLVNALLLLQKTRLAVLDQSGLCV
jgi:hypothetical protein